MIQKKRLYGIVNNNPKLMTEPARTARSPFTIVKMPRETGLNPVNVERVLETRPLKLIKMPRLVNASHDILQTSGCTRAIIHL